MQKYPKEIDEVLEDIYIDHGISPNDSIGQNLFFKSLKGSYLYNKKLKVNGILLGDIPPDIEYKSGIYEKFSFSYIEGDYYRNYYLPIWGWLSENFIKEMGKSYSPETCQRILQNFKNVRVGFTYSHENEQGGKEQKDPLGRIKYDFDTKEIDLVVYLHQIIYLCALNQLTGVTPINPESIFIGTLLHELAHLISTETFDDQNAKNNQNILELQDKEFIDLNIEEILSITTYRSGYNLSFINGTSLNLTSIDEAITELIAEEWFHLLQQETDIATKDMTYQVSYTREIASFRQVLREFANKTGQDYDNLFRIIKEGYIAGGQAMQTAITDILENIIGPFHKLLEEKRLEEVYKNL